MQQKGIIHIFGLLAIAVLALTIFLGANNIGNVTQFFSQAATTPNAISIENAKPGNPPSEWDIKDSGGYVISGLPTVNGRDLNSDQDSGFANIQGFAEPFSINKREKIDFKIRTAATSYKVSIYRIGYYQGNGARKITEMNVTGPSNNTNPSDKYTDCKHEESEFIVRLIDCGNWQESASWQTTTSDISGVYIAKLERTDGTPGKSHIYFVLRDDTSASDILVQTSDATWQAYNTYIGASMYANVDITQPWSTKVSYNRPIYTRSNIQSLGKRSFLFNAEYPLIRFLEKNGYNVSYISQWDIAQNKNLVKNHKAYISSGHDEYWSQENHDAVKEARDSGVNLIFMSGNTHYWKTRWESSIDGKNTPYRTLVTYKESTSNGNRPDPSSVWTGLWRDPRFPQEFSPEPENKLTGTIFTANGERIDQMKLGSEVAKNRFWRNTDVANLTGTQQLGLQPTGLLGHEWGSDKDNGFRPEGLTILANTKLFIPEKKIESFSEVGHSDGSPLSIDGEEIAQMTLYKHPVSKARVFSTGTVQWAWGLDEVHDRTNISNGGPDKNVQQATVNILADMNVFPSTLQSGLVPTTASTDTALPTTTINSIPASTKFYKNAAIKLTGTASDSGGSVAGVEVSSDNGAIWHPTMGTSAWTYTFYPKTAGSVTVKARAIDDSLNTGVVVNSAINIEESVSGWYESENVTHPIATPQSYPISLGIEFKPLVNGKIYSVKYYKGYSNVGVHKAQLWNAASPSIPLAEATFENESDRGWQTVSFASPISLTANTTYVASYTAPQGKFAFSDGYFNSNPIKNSSLELLQGRYGGPSAFPSESYNQSNYWIDIVFVPDTQITPPVSNTSISGRTFVDTNADFTYQNSEIGLTNKTITLYGPLTKTTSADSRGNFSFTNLPAGNYRIKTDIPAGLNPETDNDSPVSTTASAPNAVIDFAFRVTNPVTAPAVGNAVPFCSQGTQYINFTWTSLSTDPATQYQIYRRTDASPTPALVGTTSGTSLTNPNLTANTKYYYQVKAQYGNGSASQLSDPTFFVTSAPACN